MAKADGNCYTRIRDGIENKIIIKLPMQSYVYICTKIIVRDAEHVINGYNNLKIN